YDGLSPEGGRRAGEPVTRSSWEGVHLKLQIKRRGLGPHGGALPEIGLFGLGQARKSRVAQKTL
ncbi:MAG: hypothetical protein IKK82_10425, partial [Kiritimatiellae bacterium]|nr:hypothetical protein [Kiritimatiellia bacterium]